PSHTPRPRPGHSAEARDAVASGGRDRCDPTPAWILLATPEATLATPQLPAGEVVPPPRRVLALSASAQATVSERHGRRRAAASRLSGEQCAVAVDGRLATEVGVEHVLAAADLAPVDQVDQPGHRLPLVHRVGDHALGARGQSHGFHRGVVGNAVDPGVVAPVGHDLLVAEIGLPPDAVGGVAGDAADLLARLRRLGRRVDADDASLWAARVGELGESGDHACLGAARDRADDDRVEEDAEFAFLGGHFVGPVGETETAERVVGGARRNGVRRAAGFLDVADGLLPAFLEADAELGADEPDVRAGQSAEQDVADPVVDGIRPVDPTFLDQDAFHPGAGGHRGDLASVIGLHAADGDEGVAALRQGVGDQVLELAGLVATEGDAGVAVFPLGPDRRAAE